MPVLLGLDFGQVRIGVAVSDEAGSMAFPLGMIEFKSRKHVLAELEKIFTQYHARKIIVGLPKTMKGEIGPAAQKVMENVEWFKAATDREWILWDERLTTKEVERILIDADVRREKRKEVRDQLAAQRILQSYLDSHREP